MPVGCRIASGERKSGFRPAVRLPGTLRQTIFRPGPIYADSGPGAVPGHGSEERLFYIGRAFMACSYVGRRGKKSGTGAPELLGFSLAAPESGKARGQYRMTDREGHRE